MGDGGAESLLFLFFFCSLECFNCWWAVVAWSRKSCLGSAEIACFVFLVLFEDWGRRAGLKLHLFVSDVNQENEDAGLVQDFLTWPQGLKDFP